MDALTGSISEQEPRILVFPKNARRGSHTIKVGRDYNPDASRSSKTLKKLLRTAALFLKREFGQPVVKSSSASKTRISSFTNEHHATVAADVSKRVFPTHVLDEFNRRRENDFLNDLERAIKSLPVPHKNAADIWKRDYPLVSGAMEVFNKNVTPFMAWFADENEIWTNLPKNGEGGMFLSSPDHKRGIRIIKKQTSVRGLALEVVEGVFLNLPSEDICTRLHKQIKACQSYEVPVSPSNGCNKGDECAGGQGVLVLLAASGPSA